MKRLAMLGSAVTICGFLTAQSLCAEGLFLRAHLPEFLLRSSRGYLGVNLGETKDPHAAEIVVVDHDAPASKAGLRVHDVILQLDGKPFENVEQLRHKLREMHAGRTIHFLISRDSNRLTVGVQLCDQQALREASWQNHFSVPPPVANGFVEQGPSHGAFLDSMIPKTPLYVGVDLNPVRTQLAGYFGVTRGTGLLVENVDSQSPAEQAGLTAGDVVVKVESQPMASKNDWAKALRSHRGRLVQLTVMRHKQEQLLTMSVGKPKKN